MSDREIINAIKDSLQTNLEDPRFQWTGVVRNFIHTDNPLTRATYPRIQIRKRGPTNTQVISMGMNDFLEWRELILDIQFWTKSGFKYDTGSSVFIKDEELTKEWLEKIWQALKGQHLNLRNNSGITGFKDLGQGSPYLEPDTQLYTGIISVRVWEFRR